MNALHLRHDPTLGTAPEARTRRHPTVTVDFRNAPTWPAAGCPGCGTDLNRHVWQLADGDNGAVIECGFVGEER